MVTNRTGITEGMTVFSSDGEKLGKVSSFDDATFTIEKGFFFPKDYLARYEDIADVTGDEIRLAIAKDAFLRLRESGAYGHGYGATRDVARSGGEDIRMPVVEEELDVVKRERDAGSVRLRKDVVTETKHVDVPVTREEVRVERVPATERREPLAGERAFEKDSVSVPIHEEEVEIRKRPVVKEEVRLRKERVTEQRAAEADLRKEQVDVEGEGGAHRATDEDESRDLRTDPYGATPKRGDDDL